MTRPEDFPRGQRMVRHDLAYLHQCRLAFTAVRFPDASIEFRELGLQLLKLHALDIPVAEF
ncbi:hypothetical protein BCEN4_520023 [Burkholderia cenocepacia]|nr:hypothetical protein BCEN4_520023 [Burkholderia cenocepacia]